MIHTGEKPYAYEKKTQTREHEREEDMKKNILLVKRIEMQQIKDSIHGNITIEINHGNFA